MNALLRAWYAAAGQAARLGAAILPAASRSKLVRAITARRGLLERFEHWAAASRDPGRRLIWIHAPSVGEGLQARPVVEWLRANRPELQLAYTFFSPSAERFASTLPVDFADYLPFDIAGDVRRALRALQPSALVFSKLDVWPELCRQAAHEQVPLGMVSATVAPGSSRLGALSGALLRDAYASLARVGAVSEDDARRLRSLGVPAEAIQVTGDTRYDQVWARTRTAQDSPMVLALRSERPTLVAGSTWPADEAVLLPAWRALVQTHADARLLIAPHEPTPAHFAPIEAWARANGMRLARLGATDAAGADVIVIDRVGVLGDLYALATAAFVGGGFHAAGLHSVLEPAAFGVPVAFGPQHDSARDARLLMNAGGGRAVVSSEQLLGAMESWLYDPEARDKAGAAAKHFVEEGLGASERSARLVESLLR